MLERLVSQLGPDAVSMIVVVTVTAVVILAMFGMIQWRRVRQAEIEAALKQEMLGRGMSVEDIERVLKASSPAAFGCSRRAALRHADDISHRISHREQLH
jgi:hypothetical protein